MNGLKYHYEINGIDFLLKESFTQDELNEISYITRSLKATSENQIEGNLTKKEANRFLELTLISNQNILEDVFDTVDEVQFIEIFKDFFLNRIKQVN